MSNRSDTSAFTASDYEDDGHGKRHEVPIIPKAAAAMAFTDVLQ